MTYRFTSEAKTAAQFYELQRGGLGNGMRRRETRSIGRATNMIDRQRGCLFGLAVGDALGAAVEFERPGTFPAVTGYRGGGPHGLAAGEWTDDTSMALALADSIGSVGWDLNDQANRYVQWWRGKFSVNGRCFDIGVATHKALAEYVVGRDALISGERSETSSGNGSIMRLAPRADPLCAPLPRERSGAVPAGAGIESADARERAVCVGVPVHGGGAGGVDPGKERDEVLSPEWAGLREVEAGELPAEAAAGDCGVGVGGADPGGGVVGVP